MTGIPDPLFGVLATLTLVLVAAHGLGALAARVGFAPVVGELLTGLVLGPAALGLLAPELTGLVVPIPAWLDVLASLGLVLLLLLAGTEVDVAALRRHASATAAVAAGGFVVPFVAGIGVTLLLPSDALPAGVSSLAVSLVVGTALAVSAVPVTIRVLVDLDALDRPVGQRTLVIAAVVDAVGWLVFSVVADAVRTGGVDALRVGRTLLVLAGFVLLAATVGRRVVDVLLERAARARSPALSQFSAVVLVGFATTAAGLAVAVEAVVGAFTAGVLAGRRLDEAAGRVLHVVALGLLAPLFFATAGLRVDVGTLLTPGAAGVAALLLVVAVASKAAGVALGGALAGLSRAEIACLAVGLNARGAMEIVIASLGLALGVLSPTLYAAIVVVAVATSVAMPPLLRRALVRLPADA
ncbi:Kef-type K+ transport system membrane component KefB [Halarchaeum solikamskense]|uniref:cation:proton antiporter n=1 Tax=Halarchaeum nitratireducens TaxID=489913 RepID=UPI001B3AC78F|nr:cation:proton antiporter [Halarchaeum solikamskense]MBP2251402.1 Kef-type K+ transport system membrane component KefB [Halarchaeum solikamskense]